MGEVQGLWRVVELKVLTIYEPCAAAVRSAIVCGNIFVQILECLLLLEPVDAIIEGSSAKMA